MSVIVLDARWPEMLPAAAFRCVSAPVALADAVPETVGAALAAAGPAPGEGAWVTLDACDAESRARIARGEAVLRADSLNDPVAKAVSVMSAARARGEWEAGQSHETLLPYLAEEAGEFAAAVRSQAPESELLAELSDVLLQVLFHAELARERGAWDFAAVAARFTAKMRSRAPYLFDGSTGRVDRDTQDAAWAAGKARERQAPAAARSGSRAAAAGR